MITYLLTFLVGCFAGAMTGLMGASGMMVVVPCMILLGYSAYQAVGISLAVDVIAAVIVAAAYYRHDRVDLRRGLWIAIAAIIGAQLGSHWIVHVPESGLSGGFGILLIITAIVFWREGIGHGGVSRGIDHFQNSQLARWLGEYSGLTSTLIGLVVGVISGLFGVGGGILFLFALLLMGYPLHVAVGTSTMIMALTALSGAIGHATVGNLPYITVAIASIGTVLGSFASARFANRLDEEALGKAIAILFSVLGVGLILLTLLTRNGVALN